MRACFVRGISQGVQSLHHGCVQGIKGFSLLCVFGALAACGSSGPHRSPSASDQSSQLHGGIKDANYHLVLVESESGEEFEFHICHTPTTLAADSGKGCVNAFVDFEGNHFVVDAKIVSGDADGGVSLEDVRRAQVKGLLKGVVHVAGAVAAGGFATAALKRYFAPAALVASGTALTGAGAYKFLKVAGKPLLVIGTVVGGVLIFIPEETAEKIGIDKSQVRAFGQGAVDAGAWLVEKLSDGFDYFYPRERQKKFNPVVWGQSEVSLWYYWSRLMDGKTHKLDQVRERIPDILPVLASLLLDSRLAYYDEIVSYCIPIPVSASEVEASCTPVDEKRDTGDPFFYKISTHSTYLKDQAREKHREAVDAIKRQQDRFFFEDVEDVSQDESVKEVLQKSREALRENAKPETTADTVAPAVLSEEETTAEVAVEDTVDQILGETAEEEQGPSPDDSTLDSTLIAE